MKLRKLHLKKAALLTATSAAVIISSCAHGSTTVDAETAKEPTITVETNVDTTAKPAKTPTENVKKSPTTYNEEELFDDLLTSVDGYDSIHDYDNILESSKGKTTTEPVVTEETETETEVVDEPVKEETTTKENENPYIQYDSEGDAFVALDENGNFIENPEAPEKYATEEEATKEVQAQAAPAEEKVEVSDEAIASVQEFFGSTEEKVVDYINASDFEGASKDLGNTIVSGLDFLFFGGKINEFTKKQVDKDTIIYVVGELNNNISIANDLNSGWTADLAAKYLEAMNYLNAEDVDKFDAIGDEIKKNNPEEEASLTEGNTLSR